MTDDLIERLREDVRNIIRSGNMGLGFVADNIEQAADRIATQQEAIDELVAFAAEVAAELPVEFRHDGSAKAGHVYRSYCAGRFDRARSAARALLSKHGERT